VVSYQIRWVVVVFLLSCAATPSVGADTTPGLDCAKVTKGSEQAICSDPVLVGQDRQIAAAYVSDEKDAPPTIQESLQRGQENWLRLRDMAWGMGGISIACLHNILDLRLKELTAKPASNTPPEAIFLKPIFREGFPYFGTTVDVDVERLLDLNLPLGDLGSLNPLPLSWSGPLAFKPQSPAAVRTCRDWLVLTSAGWWSFPTT
jgi:hypothetical protein